MGIFGVRLDRIASRELPLSSELLSPPYAYSLFSSFLVHGARRRSCRAALEVRRDVRQLPCSRRLCWVGGGAVSELRHSRRALCPAMIASLSSFRKLPELSVDSVGSSMLTAFFFFFFSLSFSLVFVFSVELSFGLSLSLSSG